MNSLTPMQTPWIYILVGRNNTGKTTVQKNLMQYFCGAGYEKLPVNKILPVTRSGVVTSMESLSTANRSFQEKKDEYLTIQNYFENYFQDASAAVISSHSFGARDEIEEMIHQGKRRFYNVAGVFFSNAVDDEVREISAALNWDERIYLNNPIASDNAGIENNLLSVSNYLAECIARKFW